MQKLICSQLWETLMGWDERLPPDCRVYAKIIGQRDAPSQTLLLISQERSSKKIIAQLMMEQIQNALSCYQIPSIWGEG